MFIVLTIYTIPFTSKNSQKVLRTNLEIAKITGLSTVNIYLLNKEEYLVKAEVFTDNTEEEKIKEIIEYLKIDNTEIPKDLNGYIEKNIHLLDYSLEDKKLSLNFSKEFLEGNIKEKEITGIVYSLLEQDRIVSVSFLVEGKPVEKYQNLTKDIGINKEYFLTSREDIQKVVIYYLDNSNTYYVPVTKYVNDNREKIEIIVEELRKTHKDLISLENIHTELLDYKEVENVFQLNFNEYLLDQDEVSKEKILQSIAYSVFDNYDVHMVLLEVNGKNLKYFNRN